MTYSFTKPTSKHIFKPVTKIWGFYFAISFGILIGFNIFLSAQIEGLKEQREIMKLEQEHVRLSTEALVREGERLNYELGVIKYVRNKDDKLRKQIENILNMIPNQVAISEIKFENNRLFMRGIAASKEVFETSLESQLRSIYSKSESSIYALPSGWYNFESISQTSEGDGLLQRID